MGPVEKMETRQLAAGKAPHRREDRECQDAGREAAAHGRRRSRATRCCVTSAPRLVHEDGRTAEGCVELAYICEEPMCLCREDTRLMRLQTEQRHPRLHRVRSANFDGPGRLWSSTRSLRRCGRAGHSLARTQVTDWSPQHIPDHAHHVVPQVTSRLKSGRGPRSSCDPCSS